MGTRKVGEMEFSFFKRQEINEAWIINILNHADYWRYNRRAWREFGESLIHNQCCKDRECPLLWSSPKDVIKACKVLLGLTPQGMQYFKKLYPPEPNSDKMVEFSIKQASEKLAEQSPIADNTFRNSLGSGAI